jgi:catechol 2,3-dioxygenase
MPLTHLLTATRGEFTCCDPGPRQTTFDQPSRPSSDRQSTSAGHRISGASASRKAVCPTLHHFGLKTSNLDAMVDWYGKVLGMKPNHRTEATSAAQGDSRWRIAWLSNDVANHRISIMALPRLADDEQRSRHKGVHHIAFEYPTLDDLLATYARLKLLAIEPVCAADHGTTTSFYYEDPDHNSIELMVDNFGDGEQSSDFMRRSPEFANNPMGADVDPEQIHAARATGMSIAEIHERAYAGNFCGAKAYYRHCLVAAANQTAAR